MHLTKRLESVSIQVEQNIDISRHQHFVPFTYIRTFSLSSDASTRKHNLPVAIPILGSMRRDYCY